MATKAVLYSYYRSSCSWRVRIALTIKGIEYEYRAVDLFKNGGEHLTADYQKMNPIRQVPTLMIDGHTLMQSIAILEYLEETPGKSLMPQHPAQRAKVRAFCETINSGIQPLQNMGLLPYLGKEQQGEDFAKHWVMVGLNALEELVKESSGRYCFGDCLTLADLCLVPQVYNAVTRFQVDMAQFPTLNSINDHLNTLEAFQVSHPKRQPDAPEDLKQ